MESRERRAPTLLFGEAHYLPDSAKITRRDSIRESEAKLSSPKEKSHEARASPGVIGPCSVSSLH